MVDTNKSSCEFYSSKPPGRKDKKNSVISLFHYIEKTFYKHVHLEYFYTTVSFTSMEETYEAMGK